MIYENKFEVFKDYVLKTLSYYLDYPLVRPERVNIATTFSCPLNCEMCSIVETEDVSPGEELGIDDWKSIIDQIAEWGIEHVSFSGGETLARKGKTIQLMDYAKKRGLEIDLITNGYYMDRETTKKIIDTGVDRISLSVDGSDKETHDGIRGSGSFSQIMEAIKYMNQYRDRADYIEYEFTTVVMKNNYDDLVDVYEMMRDNDFDFINYQALIPDNSFNVGQNYNDKLWLDGDEARELREISEKLIGIKKRTGAIRNTRDYLRAMPEYFTDREKYSHGKCMAGYEVVHIDPYGNIDLCGFTPQINIDGKDIREVWKGKKYKELRKQVKKCRRPCLLLCYRKLNLPEMFKTHLEAIA